MKTYEDGVRDALTDLTFEEAIAAGFPEPYSMVTQPGYIKNLLLMRRKKLLKETK